MNESSIINTSFSEPILSPENSQEVLDLVDKLDINNTDSIMSFGQSTTNEISHFSDELLNSMETTTIDDSGTLLVQLNKIMDKFDIKDFKGKKQGFLAKVFKKAHNSIECLFKKYHTMGSEIDKIYIELKKYQSQINSSNKNLQEMFNKNIAYYKSLQKYIFAGNLIIKNFKNDIIPNLQLKFDNSMNEIDNITLSNATETLEILQQRVYDLELAKNIAIQTMPQIKLIQKGNYNLIRKINSAFIITIPIFKQCLTRAITLKKQEVQSKAMASLDEKTNELLLRNAENTAFQSKLTATLASGSSIQIETLEKTWATIFKSIEETKQIEFEAIKQREQGTTRLHQLQQDLNFRIKG